MFPPVSVLTDTPAPTCFSPYRHTSCYMFRSSLTMW